MGFNELISKISKSESILLAFFPFIGSYVAFVFECGYLHYYDVPISIIQLDFTRIIESTFLVVIFSSCIPIYFMIMAIICRGTSPLRRALMYPLIITGFLGAFIFFAPGIKYRYEIIFGVFFVMTLFEFIPPIFGKEKGYLNRLTSHINKEAEISKNENNSTFLGNFSVLFFGSMFIALLGSYHASGKESYWILKDSPNMVVVEIYGNTIALKEFDSKSNKILENIKLINRETNSPISMKLIKTGPLSK